MVFSLAMLVARLAGDHLVAWTGALAVLFLGGLTTTAGIAVALVASGLPVALVGFVLIGLGAGNLVPVLFSAAGRQKVMPPGIAIAAVTTTGYAGLLVGPALVGFLSDAFSLTTAFWALACLMLTVPACARWVGRL